MCFSLPQLTLHMGNSTVSLSQATNCVLQRHKSDSCHHGVVTTDHSYANGLTHVSSTKIIIISAKKKVVIEFKMEGMGESPGMAAQINYLCI